MTSSTFDRRSFLKLMGAGAMAAGLPACLSSRAHVGGTRQRPNVLVILTDDQGYGDMSCHGHPVLKTPNIDRLHDESIRLTDFHVVPMCAPTRGELMSGVHCLRNRAMATSLGRHLLKPELPIMPEMFADAGYATGIFGKWHLGDSYPYRPMDRGFQEAVYFHGFGLTGCDSYWNNDYQDPYYRHNGELARADGYCTDVWFDSAMDWMKQQEQKDTPFLCYLPTNVPHFPMWVEDAYKEEFAAYGGDPSGFFGMIVELDENLGRLEKFLQNEGLRDNTIVMFMTDNGHAGKALDVYNAGMRGGKCSRYDGGHRVPCFIRWPAGGLGEARDIPTPAQVTDVLPTLLQLCDVPAAGDAAFDGESLVPLLRGEDHDLDDRMLVVQYFQNSISKDDAAVVWKKWRLVFGKELYDLTTDPGQQNDVAAEHPDIVAKLKGFYDEWWAGVEPGINEFSAVTIGSPHEELTTLTSCEWEDVRCDGIGNVRSGSARNNKNGGPWNVYVDRPGEYEVVLRRWPVESGLGLTDAAPVFKAAYDTVEAGVALPVAAAVLDHAGEVTKQDAEPGADGVLFTLHLDKGRTKLHGKFVDADGADLCGAFYGYIRRRET